MSFPIEKQSTNTSKHKTTGWLFKRVQTAPPQLLILKSNELHTFLIPQSSASAQWEHLVSRYIGNAVYDCHALKMKAKSQTFMNYAR